MEEIKQEIQHLLDLTELQVEEYGYEELIMLLESLELNSKQYNDNILSLVKLINYCKELNCSNPKIIELILKKWCTHDIDIDGVIGDLAANMTCSNDTLKYLLELFPDSTIINILDTHIRTRYGSGMIFSLVANRLLEASQLKTLEKFEWKHLLSVANETKESIELNPNFINRQNYFITKNNKDVFDYINEKLQEHKKKKLAPVPDWVELLEDETMDKYKDFEEKNQVSTDEDYYKLYSVLKSLTNAQKIEPNDLGDEAPATTEEISEIFVSLQSNTYKNKSEFPIERLCGPANSILGQNCISAKNGIGPCRMFNCMCREYDEDESDDEIITQNSETQNNKFCYLWFTGQCDVCHRGIRKYNHSVRFPVDGGGWIGCYCSFKCLRNNKIRSIYQNDNFRINEIEKIIQHSGIADLDE